MKSSDYIVDFLVKKGIKHTFGITGGAIVHLFDSLDKNPNIQHICTHHEQAAAMAADAYARVTKGIGVGIATSGPGATNLLTGTACSYFDSIPTVFLTGQVPRSQLRGKSLSRQVGFQETPIEDIFKPVTKYSKLVLNPEDLKYELEKSFYLAKSGRPGPVLLDIPDDVQRAEINPDKLREYQPPEHIFNKVSLEEKIDQTITLLENSKRPIVILGHGIKLSGTESFAKELVETLQIPFALTWGTIDMFPENYPLSARDFGVTANRPGNFAVQNADMVLAIGTRLDTHETGSKLETFAREAKKVVIDIDSSEIEKFRERNLAIDVPINYDIRDFFENFNPKLGKIKIQRKEISDWGKRVEQWKKEFPICPKEYFSSERQINPYVFLDALSNRTNSEEIIIPEAGCNVTWGFQAYKVREGQRIFTAYNHSPMGYGIPAALGACFANNKNRVVTLVGDGGFMMNEQELATITKHNLPVKIFVMNNQGYGMIQQTQEVWLNSRYAGSTPKSFYIPDMGELARAHGIKNVYNITDNSELLEGIDKTLSSQGPALCDVKIHPESRIFPKLSFGKPIEDSEPLLDRETFNKNMIVKPI